MKGQSGASDVELGRQGTQGPLAEDDGPIRYCKVKKLGASVNLVLVTC